MLVKRPASRQALTQGTTFRSHQRCARSITGLWPDAEREREHDKPTEQKTRGYAISCRVSVRAPAYLHKTKYMRYRDVLGGQGGGHEGQDAAGDEGLHGSHVGVREDVYIVMLVSRMQPKCRSTAEALSRNDRKAKTCCKRGRVFWPDYWT